MTEPLSREERSILYDLSSDETLDAGERAAVTRALSLLAAPSGAPGWKLVPREPTLSVENSSSVGISLAAQEKPSRALSSDSLTKFTPGPWKRDGRPAFGEWFVRQDPQNWNGMGYQLICSLPSDKRGTHYGEMFRANADLIAAAPELYKALAELLSNSGWTNYSDDELRGEADLGNGMAPVLLAARAALSKARGESTPSSGTPRPPSDGEVQRSGATEPKAERDGVVAPTSEDPTDV